MANLKDLMSIDPFYQAGLIDLSNVRSFEDDPRLQLQTAPYAIDPTALAKEKVENYGYTWPGDPLTYVGSLNKPTMETAATTTHEGIHKVFDPFAKNPNWDAAVVPYQAGKEANSALGTSSEWDELMTSWLENQIYGDKIAPFRSMYETMDRPGQGALGRKGIMELLAKRGMPFLKKIALQAHKNIERKYKPSKKTYVAPPRGGGADVMPTPPKKTYVSPARPHGNGGGRRPDKPGGFTDPGKGSYGPHMAYGGLMDIPLPGRRRDI